MTRNVCSVKATIQTTNTRNILTPSDIPTLVTYEESDAETPPLTATTNDNTPEPAPEEQYWSTIAQKHEGEGKYLQTNGETK